MTPEQRHDLDRHITGNWGEDSVPTAPEQKRAPRRRHVKQWDFQTHNEGCARCGAHRIAEGQQLGPWTLNDKLAPYCEVAT